VGKKKGVKKGGFKLKGDRAVYPSYLGGKGKKGGGGKIEINRGEVVHPDIGVWWGKNGGVPLMRKVKNFEREKKGGSF